MHSGLVDPDSELTRSITKQILLDFDVKSKSNKGRQMVMAQYWFHLINSYKE